MNTIRPKQLNGETYKTESPFGNLYVTINNTEEGIPYEIFTRMGKSGSDIVAMTEGYGRLLSLILKSGGRLEEIVAQLEGIGGITKLVNGDKTIHSLPDAIAQVIKQHLKERKL